MRPRVLFLDHTAEMGGAELSLLDIARHGAFSREVVLLDDGPFHTRLREAGVPVRVIPAGDALHRVTRSGGLLRDLRALPGIGRLVATVRRLARPYDLLYANSQKAFVVAACAGLGGYRPVLWHLRDLLQEEHFSRLHRRLVTRLANLGATRVIANSRATGDAFVHCGGQRSKLRVIYNGIDPQPFEATAALDLAALRRSLGLTAAPVVSLCSRLAPWKGQHIFLDALARLPEVQGLLVGEALFSEDHAYAEALRRQVVTLGLQDRVHFLGFQREVAPLLRLSDVVIHSSVAPEPFGRVIVEGMLSGRPVIAAHGGGAAEIIAHEHTGLLTPPGDPAALADALARLLARPSWAAALAAAGQSAARQRFTLPAMLRAIEQTCAEVGGARPRSPSMPEATA